MNIQKYLTLPFADKKALLHDIAKKYPRFTVYYVNYDIYLKDEKTDILFSYIPEGEYIRGLSQQEQCNVEKISMVPPLDYEEMRPTQKIEVSPFLISCCPITNGIVSKVFSDMTGNASSPAYCTKEQVDSVCEAFKMRLPTETEWEYAVRAGENTLFPFGNELPDEEKLEKFMHLDFSKIENEPANPLGLYGLFTGEWCSSHYSKTYNSPPSSKDYVIRGGAAQFWPWQDEEWVWCMSAMRMPSSDLIDGLCAFRLVLDIE